MENTITLRSICYIILNLACTMQNILVLIIEAKHAGAILPQCFEDVKMAVSGSKVKRSAFLNTYLVSTVSIKKDFTW